MKIKSFINKLLFSTLILCVLSSPAMADEGRIISIYVDNVRVEFDSHPYIHEGHTMVPMRGVMEALGAKVSWEENNQTASAFKNSVITKFTIGSYDYYKNGALEYMPAAACMHGGRTYVPLRAISESFGFKVSWEESTSTIYITSENMADPEENIYYIKGESGKYLSSADDTLNAVKIPSERAMWALECVDREENIYCIYSLGDLYNPVGFCSHTNNRKEDKSERLRPCTKEKHLWIIKKIDSGKYVISPKDNSNLSLDADTASIVEKAVLIELIPCV